MLFVCCTRIGGLQPPARIPPLHQEKTRCAEVGKPFPCDLRTLQDAHKQELLEEHALSNALRARWETQDRHLNSGDQVVLQLTGCPRTLEEQSMCVLSCLVLLPPTGQTTKMKTHTPLFVRKNPSGLIPSVN